MRTKCSFLPNCGVIWGRDGVKEPEEIVTKRTIDGALGILKACLNSSTVKTEEGCLQLHF